MGAKHNRVVKIQEWYVDTQLLYRVIIIIIHVIIRPCHLFICLVNKI